MKSPRTSSSLVPLLVVGAVVWLTVTPVGAEQDASNKIQQEVERALQGDDYERVNVSVVVGHSKLEALRRLRANCNFLKKRKTVTLLKK